MWLPKLGEVESREALNMLRRAALGIRLGL